MGSWAVKLCACAESMEHVFCLEFRGEEGIWNRPTESGRRWQTAGCYAVDGDRIVRWGGPAQRADEIPDFEKAVQSLTSTGKAETKL